MLDKHISEPLAFLYEKLLLSSSTKVISLIGAGGKTSALFWLAREFAQTGKRVMVTTTTRMYLPEENIPVVICQQAHRLPATALLAPICACFSGWEPEKGKVRGFSPEEIDRLAATHFIDVLLVEADGAHGLPLKAPAQHEPCIPSTSDCVIAVTGGQVLGHPVGVKNVHRWPLFSALVGLSEAERFNLESIKRFIRHREGMFKSTPSHAMRIWLINQFSQSENVIEKLPALLNDLDLDAIWLGAVRETPAVTHVLRRSETTHH